MIFDIILLIMLITTLSKARSKGCTEDMNFAVGFLIVVRIAGAFYPLVSKILMNFISNESFSMYAAYALLVVIVFFLFNAIVGQNIIEFGKKIPKTTGTIITYIFSALKTAMIYSVIFTFLYTLPVLHKMPENLITPKTYRLTYGILGRGTENLFENLSNYLTETLKNPIKFMEAQKSKQAAGSQKRLDAVKSHGGLGDFAPQEKPPATDKKEAGE
jgi:uncharacterized membrane protein required for colicin V production